MKGKIVLITGATDGIGKQTALELAGMGARLILHARNREKGEKVVGEIKSKSGNDKIDLVLADFTSLDEIKRLGDEIIEKHDKIDVLINNAGVQLPNRVMTPDGFETMYEVNYLAVFLLTSRLLSLVMNSNTKRIIIVASQLHSAEMDFENLQGEKEFSLYPNYAVSKLCSIMFCYDLARRLRKTGVTVNAVHPGLIATNLNPDRTMEVKARALPVEKGTMSIMHLATSRDMGNVSGSFYNAEARTTRSRPISYNKAIQRRLWALAEKQIGEEFLLPEN